MGVCARVCLCMFVYVLILYLCVCVCWCVWPRGEGKSGRNERKEREEGVVEAREKRAFEKKVRGGEEGGKEDAGGEGKRQPERDSEECDQSGRATKKGI